MSVIVDYHINRENFVSTVHIQKDFILIGFEIKFNKDIFIKDWRVRKLKDIHHQNKWHYLILGLCKIHFTNKTNKKRQ